MREEPQRYSVMRAHREPLLRFMVDALVHSGCRIIYEPPPDLAPFRITFETKDGERIGIEAYAFLANKKKTNKRPVDEHRFQIKYGSKIGKDGGVHQLWQDPYGLYVTLLLGIDPERGIFVAADPILHSPTRFSVSVEFKSQQVADILDRGWCAWERERRGTNKDADNTVIAEDTDAPLFEALVGGTAPSFLRLIRFEREVLGEAPGERHYVAMHPDDSANRQHPQTSGTVELSEQRLHRLAREFELEPDKVLDLIAERRMLRVAVRGSVAEEHLLRSLSVVDGVDECRRLPDGGGPDIGLRFGGRDVTVECKNTSAMRTAEGFEKIDLQRTRAAKSDPCSRYYQATEFDVVAACVHPVTGRWKFKYALSRDLDVHGKCPGRLSNNVKLDERWTSDPKLVLERLLKSGP